MADNRRAYTVTIGGIPHTMMLTPQSAARYGDNAVEVKAKEPANKQRVPRNKSGK